MRISKLTVGIFISMIFFSIFLANVVNLLSTDALALRKFTKDNYLQVSDSADNLIWFLQISDLHISIFRDPLRITEFKEFCHYTVDAIKPRVVLASGDLTDAKTKDTIGSEQYEGEWKHYSEILRETSMREKTLWLDIRGNHDNFNVADMKSKHNYFTNYSVQGKEHPRSYMYEIKNGNSIYSFIGIDACLEPGPRRPFNFVGMLDTLEVDVLNALIKKSEASGSNYTIWFGHFPTSCILTPGKESVRDIIGKQRNSLVYVCGHLHTLGGIVPRMYTFQKAGFLELELGDWKDNRMYRLLAIDHGLLSFTDLQHRSWPAILITNPKHALFINPTRENIYNLRNSTHIRVLAFSLSKIDLVKVKIDEGKWMRCRHVSGPLYVANWDTSRYFHGVHKIEVYAKDIEGRIKSEIQPFSLDGTRLSFDLLAKIALMSDASSVFRWMFFSMLVITVFPLCMVRYAHSLVSTVSRRRIVGPIFFNGTLNAERYRLEILIPFVQMLHDDKLQEDDIQQDGACMHATMEIINYTAGKIVKPRVRRNCCSTWLRKFWVLSTVDRIFWPIVLYPLFLTFGPWSIGYIVENHLGAIFAWGIFVNGAFLPGSFTYAYGFIQLLTFHVPLILIMANVVDHRFQQIILKPGKKVPIKSKICLHLPFLIVFCMQISMAYLFWLAYGTLAFLLGPLRTWSLILAAILYYQALNLSGKGTRKAAEVWHVRSDVSIDDNNINLSPIDKAN
ncbi:hypothetical protein NQ318_010971 [Aromia moschata]|uniref:Transmembrane protein 62 n=1 Tax=Aromia moschata TaxID=1265417 RepID=A0AAV8YNJ4_9CUCU|nr:hypothetical protein NQ318_010971 [Aromia moschata]